MCAAEIDRNGEASTSGRANPLDAPLGGDKSRFSAVVLDSEGVAADGALRECCVFVVPQVSTHVQPAHSPWICRDFLYVPPCRIHANKGPQIAQDNRMITLQCEDVVCRGESRNGSLPIQRGNGLWPETVWPSVLFWLSSTEATTLLLPKVSRQSCHLWYASTLIPAFYVSFTHCHISCAYRALSVAC